MVRLSKPIEKMTTDEMVLVLNEINSLERVVLASLLEEGVSLVTENDIVKKIGD